MNLKQSKGQATVEYLMILIFISMIGIKFINGFRDSVGGYFGKLAHVLAINLATGVCTSECYYIDYKNSFKQSGP